MNRKLIIRLIIWGILIFISVVTSLCVIETNSSQLETEKNIFKEKSVITDIKTTIETSIGASISDLKYLRTILDNETISEKSADLMANLKAFSLSKVHYNQIRVIDLNGQEVIRINNLDGVIEQVPEEELQYKGDRYYIEDILDLSVGDLYFSKLDLNVEHGEIETPRRIMLRIGTKLTSGEGIIVLNYDLNDLFKEIKSKAESNNSMIYLINNEGHYLYSSETKKDFSFMYSDKNDNFILEHPNMWAMAKIDKVIVTEESTAVIDQVLIDPVNTLVGEIYQKDTYWWVISYLEESSHPYNAFTNILKVVVFKYVYLLVILFIVMILSLFGIYKYREKKNIFNASMDIIHEFHETDPNAFFSQFIQYISKKHSISNIFILCNRSLEEDSFETIAALKNFEIVNHELVPKSIIPNQIGQRKEVYIYDSKGDIRINNLLDFLRMNTCHLISVPLLNISNEVIGNIVLVNDSKIGKVKDLFQFFKITSYRLSQELEAVIYKKQLNQLVLFTKNVVNNVNEGIVVYDLSYNVIEWNKFMEEATFIKSEDIVGKLAVSVLPELLSNGVYDLLKKVIDTKCEDFIELKFINPDGRVYWFKDIKKPLLDESGEMTRVLSTIIDITDFKTSEIELDEARLRSEKANEAKSTFLATMSHEIRTPLNGILGMIELTMLSEMSVENKEYLSVARSSVLMLTSVINDILDFTKIEAEKMKVTVVRINLKHTLLEIVNLFKVSAKAKKIGLLTTFDNDLPDYIFTDPVRLKQVISNLVGNAIKFTHDGNVHFKVKIMGIRENNISIKFIVSDTGIGISDKQNNVFNKFEQVEQDYTRNYGGTGLGLSISQNLVELLGGKLDYRSQVGKGSEFFFTINMTYENYAVDVIEEIEMPITKQLKKDINILIVDDDAVNRKMLGFYFKKESIQYILAENGQVAVEMFENNEIDLIFMDINMPVMNGFEAFTKIRQSNKQIPIIALTALAQLEEQEKCLQHGFAKVLTKPVELIDIKNTVNAYS